jgi:hypothetical protein
MKSIQFDRVIDALSDYIKNKKLPMFCMNTANYTKLLKIKWSCCNLETFFSIFFVYFNKKLIQPNKKATIKWMLSSQNQTNKASDNILFNYMFRFVLTSTSVSNIIHKSTFCFIYCRMVQQHINNKWFNRN